jgi:hypothetical protein
MLKQNPAQLPTRSADMLPLYHTGMLCQLYVRHADGICCTVLYVVLLVKHGNHLITASSTSAVINLACD